MKRAKTLVAGMTWLALSGLAAHGESATEKLCLQTPITDDAVRLYCGGLRYNDLTFLKDNYRRAVDQFTQALALKPDFGHAYAARGIAYFHLGDNTHANEDYDRAIQLVPDDARSFTNRAVLLDKLGQGDRAVKDFASAIALGTDDLYAYHQRAAFNLRLKKYDLAIADYNKVIALTPADDTWKNQDVRFRAYYYRAYSAYFLKRYADVIADCTSALAVLRESKDYAAPLYLRGVAKRRNGDKDGAADIDAAKAKEVNIADGFIANGIAP